MELCNCACEIFPRRSGSKARPDQQVQRYAGVPGLDLRHSRLARAETLRQLCLTQSAPSARLFYEIAQAQLDLDQSRFFGIELEKFGNRTGFPACLPQPLPLSLVHNVSSTSESSLERVIRFDPHLAPLDDVARRRPVFLREHVKDHDRVVVDPIYNPPPFVLIRNSKLMTTPADCRHRPRMWQAELF